MNTRSGQVGIVLLLLSVVMLTVGISVVSRTTSDVNISTSNEIANKALDAAESGVENALSLNPSSLPTSTSLPQVTTPDNVSVNTSINKTNVLEATIEQGYVAGVDVSGAPAQNLNVSWARSSNANSQASLVFSVFSTANPPVRRYYVGLQNGSAGGNRNTLDGFSNSSTPGDPGYSLRTTIPIQAGDYLVRIRPLYNAAEVRVRGNNLPTQQYVVKSTAQSNASRETKAVQVERSIPVPPAIFDYVLFSGTSITQ